jgi:hypothetical protein
MNSLLELVLWGAPAILLSWGLFLVCACLLVFLDDSGESGQAETGRVKASV